MSKLEKIILGFLSIVLVAISISAIVIPKNDTLATTGFVKPEFDELAIDGPPTDIPSNLNYQRAELNENIAIGMCGNLILNDDKVDIYLTSLSGNAGYLRIILFDENNKKIGQTGLIKPNQYVKSVTLDSIPNKDMPIVAKVLTYEKETYYSLGSVNVKLNLDV